MSEQIIEITVSKKDMISEGIVIDSNHTFRVTVRKQKVGCILEIEDVLFNLNSAVFLPDDRYRNENGSDTQEMLSGLDVIRAILNRACRYGSQEVLVAGHTDRSGSETYNEELSKKRAAVVVALIEDDREQWVAITKDKHVDEDIQHILKWAAEYKMWQCDPGKIDGIIGQQTKKAIREFQKQSEISIDGVVGKQTWGAIYDLYQEYIAEKMTDETDSLENRSSLNWAMSCKSVGCGETWPLSSEQKSQTDRRVEVLFFDKGEFPECSCGDGICQGDDCPIYKEGEVEWEYITIEGENSGVKNLPDFDCGEEEPSLTGCCGDYPQLDEGNEEEYDELPDFDSGEEDLVVYTGCCGDYPIPE